MIRSVLNTILTFLMILVFGTFSHAEDTKQSHLAILTENAGESNHIGKDGKLEGHNVEIVQEIMKRLGVNYDIEAVPWARGYYMAQNDPNTMLFSTARIRDREKLFKWAGPLHESKYVFYSRKDYPREIKSIEDAMSVETIGCIAEDVRHKILLQKGFKNLAPYFGLNANIQNLKKLLAGRLDLWISSPKDSIETARQLGIDHSELKASFQLTTTYTYMAFSLKTSDEIVMKWQAALDKIKADGTYEKIMSRYATGPSSMTFDKPGPAKED